MSCSSAPPGRPRACWPGRCARPSREGDFFYYLLTRFTTPDEIFGPLSLSSLQEDIFSRKVDGYLPSANVSFLDEIFKANSSILNSLLTILNERKYHNGSEILDVPLFSVFGASNELPEENESLEALYDRFLFRYYVGYVQDETNFVELILGHAEDFVPSVRLTIEEIRKLHKGAAKVPLDDDVLDSIVALQKGVPFHRCHDIRPPVEEDGVGAEGRRAGPRTGRAWTRPWSRCSST